MFMGVLHQLIPGTTEKQAATLPSVENPPKSKESQVAKGRISVSFITGWWLTYPSEKI